MSYITYSLSELLLYGSGCIYLMNNINTAEAHLIPFTFDATKQKNNMNVAEKKHTGKGVFWSIIKTVWHCRNCSQLAYLYFLGNVMFRWLKPKGWCRKLLYNLESAVVEISTLIANDQNLWWNDKYEWKKNAVSSRNKKGQLRCFHLCLSIFSAAYPLYRNKDLPWKKPFHLYFV